MKKVFLFIIMLLIILPLFSCNAVQVAESDYSLHWANESIKYIYEKGYANIDILNKNPNKELPRGEFITMLLSAVLSTDIAKKDGLFVSNAYLSRGEAALIISQAIKTSPSENLTAKRFTDDVRIRNKKYIYGLVDADIIYGRDNGKFEQNALLTIGEGATLIKRIVERAENLTETGVEIERKFLIDKDIIPPEIKSADIFNIEQTYISFAPETRVRRINGSYYSFAIKLPKDDVGLIRQEVEIYISKEEYDCLAVKEAAPTVIKTRYQFDYRYNNVAVDIYSGRHDGLAISEIEFASKEEADEFIPFTWYIKDVTSDKRYKNASLATDGMPE